MYSRYAALRDALGLSDYKVAKDIGIPPSTFSDWKSGRSKPKTEKLLKLSNYFHKPIEYFVEEEE